MSQNYSGVESNVLQGANDVDTMGWEADVEVNTYDSTTTADGGWDDTSASTSKASANFDLLYNPAKPPFGTLGLVQGTIITLLTLYINKTAGASITGSALVTKVSKKGKVKDGVVLTVSVVNKGIWILPT